MAQTIQIVPKWSFPHIETYINDNTLIADAEAPEAEDGSIKEAYAVVCQKGIDNTWVRMNSKEALIASFGDSNFKKYGQPYMQAMHVAEQENSKVWIMRVMPENATFSNAVVSAYYKADTENDVDLASERKFRIKLTGTSYENIYTTKDLTDAMKKFDGNTVTNADGVETYTDGEGYVQKQIFSVRYTGRGDCGDVFSMRMSQALSYEKEFGITMYNFEVINSEKSITKDANYVGGLITSNKYNDDTITNVEDIIDNADKGVPPIIIKVDEDNYEDLYNAYIEFATKLHDDLIDEYADRLDEFNIPEDMMNGTIPVSEDYQEAYDTLKKLNAMIEATELENLPDVDSFDPIFGNAVASETSKIVGLAFPQKLTDEVDVTAEDYNELDYTETDIIDFSSATGIKLAYGTNGYFDNPRSEIIDGALIQYTFQDEVNLCYESAYNGTFDKKIISPNRMGVTAFFDANYPLSVKNTIVQIAQARNSCRVYLDTNIIDNFANSTCKNLINTFSVYDTHQVSLDCQNYWIREPKTNKKCNVTISYFTAAEYVNHITNKGIQTPFVNENCRLRGHIRDSLTPMVEEYDVEIKEFLTRNRINFFECVSENVFQRAIQNTTQIANTDLIEESNSTILYVLKNSVENDAKSQLYNFADETTRQDFITVEKAKYQSWLDVYLESFDIEFKTSRYEFERSILHCYLAIVFRGLTKQIIIEIDINKREYRNEDEEDLEEASLIDGDME